MSVRVVVDSSASLPEHVVRELDITVVDLHRMESTTSGLSSLELAAAYARQLERGGDDGVVVVHLSGQLSSTLSNAKAAAAVFEGAVRVVDTRCAGMVTGAAAMTAAAPSPNNALRTRLPIVGVSAGRVSEHSSTDTRAAMWSGAPLR